jgi:hypothetical protein
MPTDQEKPKIIIDEDWKAQVQAEKEAAKAGESQPPTPATAAAKPEAAPTDHPLPPASLTFLLTTVATEAMIALGQVPNPITGKVDLRLQQAKHFVDTLAMLEEKTKGNRTAEESGLLSELLHQLRMAYVAMKDAPPPSQA